MNIKKSYPIFFEKTVPYFVDPVAIDVNDDDNDACLEKGPSKL
jgi:hypothetical protein